MATFTLNWPEKNTAPEPAAVEPLWAPAVTAPRGEPSGDPRDALPRTEGNILAHADARDLLHYLSTDPTLSPRYLGAVKCVYLDPPYNTGRNFGTYKDSLPSGVWLEDLRDLLHRVYPLLHPSASVWIHLDSRESHRARQVCDEVFGADNFVAEVAWKSTSGLANNGVAVTHNPILVYARSRGDVTLNAVPSPEKEALFTSPDGDPTPWVKCPATSMGHSTTIQRGGMYGIQHPVTGEMMYPTKQRQWMLGQDKLLEFLREIAPYDYGEITDDERRERCARSAKGAKVVETKKPLVIPGWNSEIADAARKRLSTHPLPPVFFSGDGSGGMVVKRYKPTDPNELGRTVSTVWADAGSNTSAKREVLALFPESVPFVTPKPEELLERVITIATNPGDIVLDFYGGSGTTAAVAHKMGRHWVTCERDEDTVLTYLLPRLTAVVEGEQGGISVSKTACAENGDVTLPSTVTPDQVLEARRVLRAVAKAAKGVDADVAATLSAAARDVVKSTGTSTETRVRWTGGGGFGLLKLAPAADTGTSPAPA